MEQTAIHFSRLQLHAVFSAVPIWDAGERRDKITGFL